LRRAWLVIVSTALVMAVGCGRENYEKRLAKTLERLEYERRVKKNLMAGATDKKFVDHSIWVQAPKDEALAKTGQLPVAEGQFDLDASFNDKDAAALHVFARVKLPKKPATKGAPPAPPPTARGEFSRDVLGVLASVFGSAEGLENPKFVEESKRGNRFKRLIFAANDKEVKVYTYKQDNHEVALVFVYDPKLRGTLATKVDLCLETFRAGLKATQIFNGNVEEDSDGGGGPAGPI